MKFLLYTTAYGKSGSIQLNRPMVWVPAALALLGVLMAAGQLGYSLGAGHQPAVAARDGAQWQVALDEQKRDLTMVRDEAQDQLNALAVRLGQMQAQMLRVEALGQRVKQIARLKKSEFDFDQIPAQGGPADPAYTEPMKTPDFLKALDDMVLQIDDRARQLELMEQVVSRRELRRAVSPAGQPISKGWLSSYYGMRTDPFHGRREMHKGIDFAGQMGADVVATAAGVVTWAGKRYGYGQLVEINHGKGYSTRYGHCNQILVKVGDIVEPGEKIALMGSSGRSTGPHVHYEVLKNGRQVNPTKFVRASR
ncbi:Peptidase, M23/M37 family [hydrothermal vent metagenome]|uniref:Peptidase, M23/M37 family n=1 Tax=hydrothermal vent metagenome TaxID=652676 RepID=A0A3B0YVI5_9ZZZZ